MRKDKYVIISPVRNEEQFVRKTLQSVICQRVRPLQWIIVNDGSTDKTEDIIKEYLPQHPWICLLNRPDRGFNKLGAGVVEVFFDGFRKIILDYDFIVKLDCDLEFEEDYFSDIFSQFQKNSKLGIASGQTYILQSDKLVWEDAPISHTRGPSKVYRKACFEDIGGLIPTLGWDLIDELTARMRGWEARSFPEYKIVHLRPLGSKDGIIRGNIRHGYASYLIGYHPLYFVLRCAYRLFYPPYLTGGVALFWGYFRSAVRREPKVVSKELQRYHRHEQISGRLLNPEFWKPYLRKVKLTRTANDFVERMSKKMRSRTPQ